MDPADRLGLNIPYEWWPTSPLLKELEAGGCRWVQIPSPPSAVLGDARSCIAHATAVAAAISTTGLRSVLHAPTSLIAGTPAADRVFEGALSYAAECGAEQVIYHARARPDDVRHADLLDRELESLARLLPVAERLGLVVAIENLAPVYPGPETISAIPLTLRALVQRCGSPALRLCLDVGHANVVAGLRRTAIAGLVDPVLDLVSVFHLHDNLGARLLPGDQRPGLDPLRLDLHLPPGRGTLPWPEVAGSLRDHDAPIILEIHPPHRPSPAELMDAATRVLAARAPAELIEA